MKKTLSLILALAMILALAACGGSKKAEPTYNDAGYYAIFSITDKDGTMSQADLDSLDWTIFLELREDGTGVLDLDDGDVTEFTWQDGSLSYGGDTVAYALAGGMLTLDLSDDDGEFVMIFKKGDKPDPAAQEKAPAAAEPEAAPEEASAPAAAEPEAAPEEAPGPAPAEEAASPAEGAIDPASPVGTYKLTYMNNEGETASEEELALMEALGMLCELRLKEDGTGDLVIFGESMGSLQWDEQNITAEGEPVPYTFEDGTLKIEIEDSAMVFTKVSDDPEAVIETSADGLAGLESVIGTMADSESAAEPETAEEPPARSADAGPIEASQLPVSGDIDDEYHVEIVGAEAFKDADGKDAIRFYYDFTNNSDKPTSAWWNTSLEAEQEGYELVTTYPPYDEYPPEDGNEDLDIQPGVTIRCEEEYTFKPSGGELVFTISDSGDDPVTAVFDPAALPGAPAEPWAIQPVEDPQFFAAYPTSASTDYVDVEIVDTEVGPDYWDDTDVLRAYFTLTNKTEKADTPWWLLTISAYQDGIELEYGTPAESVEADDLYSEELPAGETVTFAHSWALRTDSPVEIVVEDYYAYADEPVAAAIIPLS